MRRTCKWQKVIWLLLWILWLPTMMHAGNDMENSSYWMITPSGVNGINIQIPVYDSGGLDGFVDKGYLYITPEGGAKETVLYFYSQQKNSSNCRVWFQKSVDGEMVLSRDNGYSSIAVSSSEKNCELSQKSGSNLYYIYINWIVPDKYRGKKCQFSWYVHKHGNKSASEREIKLTPTNVSFTDTPAPMVPMTMDPILGYDATHAGQTMMIYTMSSNDIISMTAHYKEMTGSTYKSRSMALGKEMSGYIYLPSDKCISDFSITARYKDMEGVERTSQSMPIDLPTLHLPYGFVATLQSDGTVQLRWECKDKNWADISMEDIWDIQRNTSGDSSSEGLWQSIGQTTYEGNDTIYTFTDNTFAASYEGHPVYYRVRRSSTAMWDWKAGTYAMASLTGLVCLPAVGTATVSKGQWTDVHHQANFTFAFGQKDQYDKDGRFILRTAEDWEAFARLVNTEGKKGLDAIMAADIDLGAIQTMVGTSNRPYEGTFDGNGHTLTVCYDTVDVENAAPFSVVTSPTIKNLHVTGKIVSNKKFAAGIVGSVYGDLHLYNCRSSAVVGSTISGDATNGGLVGLVNQGSYAEVSNCLFDGQLLGKNSDSMGGLIGWSHTAPVITNCLFNPLAVDIEPKMSDCKPLARLNTSVASTSITNCYYTVPMDGSKTCIIDNKTFYILRNAEDWNTFLDKIVSAGGTSEVNAIMAADISTVYSAGHRKGIAFKGTFDGNGHTLTVNIEGGNGDYIAPFARVQGVTIKNLTVMGSVRGSMHTAGLVGGAFGTETNNILNCHVSVNVITTKTHAGGIMGHGHSAKNRINYCLFDGSVTSTTFKTDSYAGSFIGWEDGNTSNEVWHNLENGTYNNFDHVGLDYKSGGIVWAGTNNWHYKNWSEGNKVSDLTPGDLVSKLGSSQWQIEAGLVAPIQTKTEVGQGADASEMEMSLLAERLGSQWELCGNSVLPIMETQNDTIYASTIWTDDAKLVLNIDKLVNNTVRYTERKELTKEEREAGHLNHELTTSCVDYRFRFNVEQGTSNIMPIDTIGTVVSSFPADLTFHFDNNVQIDSLQVATQQATVSLAWYSSGVGDFYRILRRDTQTDETVELEGNYAQTSYIDKTPQPQHVYEYIIEGVNDCEGRHVSRISKDGWCSPMGKVRGFIRLKNGTAQAGVKVIAEPTPETAAQGGKARWIVTNSSGFFEIDSLVYQGAGSYNIIAETSGDQGSYSTFTANFSEWSNLATNVVLTLDEYYLFSGYVMYEGTSVPVLGASFEVDGTEARNGSGKPIVTDTQGKFTISLSKGQHTVRVVKEGHTFLYDGFFTDPQATDPQTHNWQKSIAGHVFWDQTRVTLQGRVAGGDVQGSKPLGKLASTNNLGDSLTIVMQLEGDNASWLVRDQLNDGIKERHTDYFFASNQKDSCHLDVYRQRLIIKPNPTTGEYSVPMLPVKYKVTEIYAEGYPTLFQAGKVGETLDLSDYQDGDTVTYSRIYHAMPTLAVRQFNMTGEDYMGIKNYTEIDNTGTDAKIELWNDSTGYAFGHPVFMAGSSCILMLSAVEQYYWNNNASTSAPDLVHLSGGKVRVQNALVGTEEAKTIELDSLGEATYTFMPQNLTFTEEGDMALKTLTINLFYDGNYYDVKPMNGEPIRGYVLAARNKAKDQGHLAVADGGTYLVDILRDPPGATSSAYIESGTKLNYSFSQNVKASFGLKFTIGSSTGDVNMFNGVWAGVGSGTVIGAPTNVNMKDYLNFNFVATYYNSWQYNYTFETNERISTSSELLSVGANADVYIGMTMESVVDEAIAVRAISDETYQRLTAHDGGTFKVGGNSFKVNQGTMKVLAEGRNSKGERVYIVRDEVLALTQQLKSTFVHTGTYIENQLLPELFKMRNALILSAGTDSLTAQRIADHEGHAVYVSKVEDDDARFGLADTYEQVNPKGMVCNDSISIYNRNILTWIEFLGVNEREKLEATDLVKRYSVDGRTSVAYSETFGLSDSETRYVQLPLVSGLGGLSFRNFTKGGGMKQTVPGTDQQAQSTQTATGSGQDDNNYTLMNVGLFNTGLYIKIQPIIGLDYNYNFGQTTGQTKKVGFTIAPSKNSSLLVDVYRTTQNSRLMKDRIELMKAQGYTDDELSELFFQLPTEDYVDYVRHGDGYGKMATFNGGLASYADSDVAQYRSFVYRTRGGATSQPYEDERRTKYYIAGSLLDEKTVAIDNLRIWADEATVSNVPYDEPARFTLHFANESEMPGMANTTLPFTIFLADGSNPKGAKVFVNGTPMSADGINLFLTPGVVETKVLEIYPGTDFDYEDIVVGVIDGKDTKRPQNLNLSAHFVPVAGKVNISLPGDKWVVNTESAHDSQRQQYYMPVRIDGFDVNYRNFDHIELQYKLSTQGDKEWVNVCSFYKDSLLLAKATGECRLMEDDGRIMATFWGEADPVEQQYDLRAVNYCRYGNGFLTRSSNVLTGVKDTRRPTLFGTPKPEDGILDIGEDIVLRFSEPIAGNYLRDLNNFQVLGQTRSNNLSLGTSLRFNGDDEACTQTSRNLVGKSFTVDVMLNPDRNGKDMTVVSHGDRMNQLLELGVSADRHLMAMVGAAGDDGAGQTRWLSDEPIAFDGLHRVQWMVVSDSEEETTTVRFYDGVKFIGEAEVPWLHSEAGPLYLGTTRSNGVLPTNPYEGEMLEFRLWNHALSASEMRDYHLRRLTGYEMGLMDNFPLNEGQGAYSYNRVGSGGDLNVSRSAWNVPDGIGMTLDGERGFSIEAQPFTRQGYQDYSLLFWFRTTDADGTLLSNGRAQDEAGYMKHFNIGLEGGDLYFRSSGRQQTAIGSVNDGGWHHVAVTVNRSRNVGNLYVDAVLKSTFAVDSLGGIMEDVLTAGATALGGDAVTDAIHGHIDEVCMFETALPENVVRILSDMSPTGEELGLLAYLNFAQNELQLDNSQQLMPTGISLKRYWDSTAGQYTQQRDTLVAQQVVERLADRANHAPMRGVNRLENIPYSFVADGKDLLINLDVPAHQIEKTNVIVTVKDIADLNGNTQASPVTMDLYVYRNPLRWDVKRVTLAPAYGEGATFTATVRNLSGKRHHFTIEGLPVWITASEKSGYVGALDEQTITFTVSPFINIGNFDEVIYLVGDDEMSEPLPVSIKVRGTAPDWALDDALREVNQTMHIVAQVNIRGDVMNDPADQLAVFGNNHELLGVTSMKGETALAYLTVYNHDRSATPLHYEYYDASTGIIHVLLPNDERAETFQPDAILGTASDPATFETNNVIVQTLQLKKGWNWLSFYVEPLSETTLRQLLNNATRWEVGYGIEAQKDDGGYAMLNYKAVYNRDDPKNPLKVWDNGDDILTLNPQQMYRFYSQNDKLAYLTGSDVIMPVTVHHGWNRLGYLSQLNLPLGTALADYTDQASEGDVIKSQSEFAVLTVDAQGNKQWQGTLEHMRAGQGYMLMRSAPDQVQFRYPIYYRQTRYANKTQAYAPLYENRSGSSMTVVAVTDGIAVEEGDTLTAWCRAECRGVAVADADGLFFLNVGGGTDDANGELTFTLERDGELLATSISSPLRYVPNATHGTPKQPVILNVRRSVLGDPDGWYDLSGRKMDNRQLPAGVYIHKNEKIIIK
ncbi:MAG: hypothetical protein J6Y38_04235 [Bacteroidaceae bacterium]|nr:hypothetical protein [Bacteroidaceae bacterium]